MNPRVPGLVVLTTVELGAFAIRLGAPAGAGLEPIRPSRPQLRTQGPLQEECAGAEVFGREDDLAQLRARLAAPGTRALVVHGASGTGKSTLLALLAADPRVRGNRSGGVVTVNARHQTAHDCALALFRLLEEDAAPPRTPSEREIRQALANFEALVVLDDVSPAFEPATLLALAPRATFILGATKPLEAEGTVNYALGGLDAADAVRLLARDLDPWSAGEQRVACRTLCTLLEGNPGRIRQLVPHAAAMGWTLGELAEHFEGPEDFDRTRLAEIASKLDPELRSILDAAALFGEATFCGGAADDPIYPDVAELEKRRMLVRDRDRFKLATGLEASLASQFIDPAILDETLEWFGGRLERCRERMTSDRGSRADLAEGLRHLAAYGRPAPAVRLGRALSDALGAHGEWRAWEEAVSHVALAADRLGDGAAQAWAHHQMGVYALATGERTIARAALAQALAIREALRDESGAAATRAGLAYVQGPRRAGLIAGIALGVVLGAGVFFAATGGHVAPASAHAPKAMRAFTVAAPTEQRRAVAHASVQNTNGISR